MDENIKKFPEQEENKATEAQANAEAPAEAQDAQQTPAEEKKPDKAKEAETLRKASQEAAHGTFKLAVPFRSDGYDISELHYDFKALTGVEYANAMDADNSRNTDSFRMTNKQALTLFATAAAKKTEHVDKDDVLRGLSIDDAIKAVQITTVFFVLSSRAGNTRIMRE